MIKADRINEVISQLDNLIAGAGKSKAASAILHRYTER
jgi:hypothetical protein